MKTTLRQQTAPVFATLFVGTFFMSLGGLLYFKAAPFSVGFWMGASVAALSGIPVAAGLNALFVRYGGGVVADIPWGPILLGSRFAARVRGPSVAKCQRVQARLQYLGQHYTGTSNSRRWDTVVMWEQTRAFEVRAPVLDTDTPVTPCVTVGFDIPDQLPPSAAGQRRFAWRLTVTSEDIEPPLSADFLVPGPVPEGTPLQRDSVATGVAWPGPPEVEPLPSDLIPPPRVHLKHHAELLRMEFMPRRSFFAMALTLLCLLAFIVSTLAVVLDGVSGLALLWLPVWALIGWVAFWSFVAAWTGRTQVEISPDGIRSTYSDVRPPKVQAARSDELVELRGLWSSSTAGPGLPSERWDLEARTRDGRNLPLGSGFDGRAHAEHFLKAAQAVLAQNEVRVPIGLYGRFESRDLRHEERAQRVQKKRAAAK